MLSFTALPVIFPRAELLHVVLSERVSCVEGVFGDRVSWPVYFITPVALPENQKYSSFRKPYYLESVYFCLSTHKTENECYDITGILMLSRM